MKIRYKLSLPVMGIISLFSLLILVFIFSNFKNYETTISENVEKNLIDGYKKELKSSTELAVSLMESIYKDDQLSQEEKIQKAQNMIRPLRFGQDGYFYAYKKGTGENIIHGTTPANEGKNLWDLQSPDKKQYIIRDLDNAAVNGSVFVNFYWSKPGEDKNEYYPKLGTAMMVPGTEIWIGTGTYIDNIDLEIQLQNDSFKTISTKLAYILLSLTILSMIILFFLIRNLIKTVVNPISDLSQIAIESQGTDFTTIPEIKKRLFPDEISILEESFRNLFLQFKKMLTNVKGASESSIQSGDNMNESIIGITNSLKEASLALQKIEIAEKQISLEADSNVQIGIGLAQFIEETKNLSLKQTDHVDAAVGSITIMQNEIDTIAQKISENDSFANELDISAKNGERDITLAVTNLEMADKAAGIINDAISMINDTTAKTNLLAMNASIEAARAGNIGKGFAVIANEIKKLAENSTVKMENITEHLQNIAKSIEVSLDSAKHAKDTFNEIETISVKVLTGMKSISENNDSIQNISGKVDDVLSGLTEDTALTNASSSLAYDKVKDLSKSASDLTSLASSLQKSLIDLKSGYSTITSQSDVILHESKNNTQNMASLSESVSLFKIEK